MAKVISLKWNGEEYTLNEKEAFLAADAVEDVLTLGELVAMRADGSKIKFAKLSSAYAAMLMEAGCKVDPVDIHKAFTDRLKGKDEGFKLEMAVEAIDWLILVLMDGAPESDEGDKEGKNAGTPGS